MASEVTAVKVYARFRPTRPGHDRLDDCDLTSDQVTIDGGKQFRFDGLLDEKSTQLEAYSAIGQPVVQEVLKGFNGSVIAYGQTGSGKTHTMIGPDFGSLELSSSGLGWSGASGSAAGLMTRIVDQLFKGADNDSQNIGSSLKVSMLEIYNDSVRDLLDLEQQRRRSGGTQPTLGLRMNPEGGFDVEGLRWEACTGLSEVISLLERGSASRATGATAMNDASSRSHMVVTVSLAQQKKDSSVILSKLRLVDLAGSERAGKTGATGQTLLEAKNINKSLSALSNCMHALTSGSGARRHVPYRDSTLTKLLMDSLGGNAKTAMVICLALDESNRSETLSTLNFGKRAKRIKCTAQVNFFGGELEELRQQNRLLREQLESLTRQQTHTSPAGGPACPGCQKLEEAEMSVNELKVKASNLTHALGQARVELGALRATKSELEKYAQDLLAQLNEAEQRRQAQASLLQSNDKALAAGREALAASEQRLEERLSALEAREAEQNARYTTWEQALQTREADLERSTARAATAAAQSQQAVADAVEGLRTDFAAAAQLQVQAEALFTELDMNGDGVLEPTELQGRLSDMGLSDSDIERLFILLDTDGDGTISREEFVIGYHIVKATLSKAKGVNRHAAGVADAEWTDRHMEAEVELQKLQDTYKTRLEALAARDAALRAELQERQAALAEAEIALNDRRQQFELAAKSANERWDMLAAADQQRAAQALKLGAALQDEQAKSTALTRQVEQQAVELRTATAVVSQQKQQLAAAESQISSLAGQLTSMYVGTNLTRELEEQDSREDEKRRRQREEEERAGLALARQMQEELQAEEKARAAEQRRLEEKSLREAMMLQSSPATPRAWVE